MSSMIFDAVVIEAGQIVSGQYDMTNINVYAADKFYDVFSPADGSGNYSITNWGTISFTSPLASPYNYSISLIYLEDGYGNWTITNHNSMSVTSDHGFAWGIRSNGWTPDFENTGTFTVSAGEQAIGIEAWGIPAGGGDLSFRNSGTFSVSGGEAAFGLYLPNGGIINNTGDILVSSQAGGHTFAIDFAAIGEGSIYNSGRIIATDHDDATQWATAISFFGNGADFLGNLTIVNDGEITGERAIFVDNNSGNEVSGASAAQNVTNHGTINGLIELGFGDDMIINSGTINGVIDLGLDNDTYDGRDGHASGPVQGYDGDDTFYSGNSTESYYGENGDDHFFVGTGVASFDGGSGSDTADFALTGSAVTVNLAQTSQTYTPEKQVSLTGIENLSGTAFNDTLTGNTAANSLWGADGNDVLSGSTGNDQLYGGTGDDTIDGGADSDDLSGGAGLDILKGGDGNDHLAGGNGDDKTTGGTGADTFFFEQGDGHDTITDFNLTTDVIDLGSDDGFSSYTTAQIGNDVLITLAEGDSLLLQNVNLASLSSSNFILLDPSPRNLIGTDNAELLTGGINDDILNGGGGNDTLQGGRGNDLLIGGKGADTIDGGVGTDTVSYETETETVIVSLGNSWGIVWTPKGGDWDTLSNIENIIGTNSLSLGETLVGNDAANTIWARAGNDTVEGNGGDDILYGESGDDTISGGAGNDVLNGGAGQDKMAGGADDDTYYVDRASDVITEASNGGTDLIYSSVSYATSSNVEKLSLIGSDNINATGNSLANVLVGNSGNNVLDGRAGADILNGGLGDDTYVQDVIGDRIIDSGGTDTVKAAFSYALGNNLENLFLTGSANLNGTGNALNNVLTGNSGANLLVGNAGNDTLNGAAGADIMNGGTGNDTYIVDNTGDVVIEGSTGGTDAVHASLSYSLSGSYVENLFLTGTANINASGNSYNNLLVGNDGNNTLNGSLGADTMNGGFGNDTYIVDNAGDIIIEGATGGTDTIHASLSYSLNGSYVENLFLTGTANINASGNSYNNLLVGNDGNNTLNGSLGADTMNGGNGNDTYIVDNAGDAVIEGATGGTDTVYAGLSYSLTGSYVENLFLTGTANINATGNAGNNLLVGNSGNNVFNGGTGADTMNGGLGNDTYYVDNAGDVIIEGSTGGTDTVYATSTYSLNGAYIENLFLTGSANINATGNSYNNLLVGNDGNNILNGGTGADTMNGGFGNDTYYVDNAGDVIIEGNGGGYDTVISSITWSLSGNYVENLALTGSANINATGNALANHLTGNTGNNTFNGGAGNDILNGGGGDDIFWFGAGSGDDTINDFTADTINLNAYSHGVVNGGGIVITQVGGNTIIDLGGSNNITLTGIAPTDLTGHIVW